MSDSADNTVTNMKLKRFWINRRKECKFSLHIGEFKMALALLPVSVGMVSGQSAPGDLYNNYFDASFGSPVISATSTAIGFELEGGANVTVNNSTAPGSTLLVNNPNILMTEVGGDAPIFSFLQTNETISSLVSSSTNAELSLNDSVVQLSLSPATSSLDPSFSVGQSDVYAGQVNNVSSFSNFGRFIINGVSGNGIDETQTFTGTLALSGGQIDNGFDSNNDTVVDVRDFNIQIGDNATVQVDNGALTQGNSILVTNEGVLNVSANEEITDLWVDGSGGLVSGFSSAGLNGQVSITGNTLEILDSAHIDGTLSMAAPTDATVEGGIDIAELNGGGGQIIANGNDVVVGNDSTTSTSTVDIQGAGDFIKLGGGDLSLSTNQSLTGATWLAGGNLTLNGSSTSSVIVTGRGDSAEAVGGSGTGGEIYNDNAGTAEAGNWNYTTTATTGLDPVSGDTVNIFSTIYDHAVTLSPALTLQDSIAAESYTIGAATNTVLDTASITTAPTVANDDIIADTATVTIYQGGQLTLGGDETFDVVDFADTTGGQTSQGLVTLSGGDLTLNALNEKVTDLTTATANTHGHVNLLGNTLNLAGDGSSFLYNGSISGTAASVINKDGSGEIVLADLNDENTYFFDGVVNVNSGILEIQDTDSTDGDSPLGSITGNTVVSVGAELQYNGNGMTVNEPLLIDGFGSDFVTGGNLTGGALSNETGANTQRGTITLNGEAAIFADTGSELELDGNIFSLTGTPTNLFTGGGGEVDLDAVLTNDVDNLYHNGSGVLDLGRGDHEHVGNTFIESGTIRIEGDAVANNAAAATTIGQLGSDLVFTSDAAQGEFGILDVQLTANESFNRDIVIDSSQTDSRFTTPTTPGSDIGTINVGSNRLSIDLAQNSLTFADPTNALYQTGGGVLYLDASASTSPVVNIGGVLNSGNGTFQIDGPGTTGLGSDKAGAIPGSSQLIINGLGTLDEFSYAANVGAFTVNGFDNLVVNQMVDTTFNGVINTSSNLVYNPSGGTLTLGVNALGAGYNGNIFAGGGTLVITGANAFGSSDPTAADPYTSEATIVCGTNGTTPRGVLGVSGGFTTSEYITLINDACLLNVSGDNTFTTAINLSYDAASALTGTAAYPSIGSNDGTLTLTNGVINNSGTAVGLNLNTDAGNDGTVNIGTIPAGAVTDVFIGNTGSTGTVNLLDANAYSGNTYFQGGNVIAGNTLSLSTQDVFVNSATSLAGSVTLANDFILSDTLTTNENTGTLTLNGDLSGTGGFTHNGAGTVNVNGTNTFTGALSVLQGTANIANATTPSSILVDTGTLNHNGGTTSSSLIVSNSGTANFNGGTVDITTGTVADTGTANFNVVTDIDTLTVDTGGIVNTGGANLLSDSADVILNGTMNLGGTDGVGSLSGNGTVNGNLVVAAGNSISPGNSDIGNLTVNGDLTLAGIYNAEVGATGTSDTITVNGGTLTLDYASSILNITDNSSGNLLDTLGATSNVIDAGALSLGFSDVVESGTSARILFDLANGNVVSLGDNFGADPNCTANENAILTGLLNGALVGGENIDTSTTAGSFFENFVLDAGTGLKGNLSALSPEGYVGAVDYAIQSLDSYSQAARTSVSGMVSQTAPSYSGYASSSYRSSKGKSVEVFGGWNSFSYGTSVSDSGNDYDLAGSGGYVGVRFSGADRALKTGFFFAYDSGTVDSTYVDLDVTGMMFGGFLDYKPVGSDLIFHADVSYGVYSYDGNHTVLPTVSSASFNNTALKAGAGLDYVLINNGGMKIIPSVTFTSITSDADSFTESGGGSPLTVSDLSATSTLLDAGLKFELSSKESFIGLNGYIGYQQDFGDTERSVTAEVLGSSFTIANEGAAAGAFIYNVGAFWDMTDTLRANVHYFGEARSGAETASGFNAGATLSF